MDELIMVGEPVRGPERNSAQPSFLCNKLRKFPTVQGRFTSCVHGRGKVRCLLRAHERKVRTRCDIMVRQRGQLVTLSGGTGIDEKMDSDDERM